MGWLKNITIKNVTKRAVNDLLMKMEYFVNEYHGSGTIDPKQVLMEIIEMRGLVGGSFHVDDNLTWDETFILYILHAVTNELSYDRTMGDKEDLKLIHETAYSALQKEHIKIQLLKSSGTVKSAINKYLKI